jgi:hypothetical protein
MNCPFQNTIVVCYHTFRKLRMKKLEHFVLVLANVPMLCIWVVTRCPFRFWVVNPIFFVKLLTRRN